MTEIIKTRRFRWLVEARRMPARQTGTSGQMPAYWSVTAQRLHDDDTPGEGYRSCQVSDASQIIPTIEAQIKLAELSIPKDNPTLKPTWYPGSAGSIDLVQTFKDTYEIEAHGDQCAYLAELSQMTPVTDTQMAAIAVTTARWMKS